MTDSTATDTSTASMPASVWLTAGTGVSQRTSNGSMTTAASAFSMFHETTFTA